MWNIIKLHKRNSKPAGIGIIDIYFIKLKNQSAIYESINNPDYFKSIVFYMHVKL